MRRDPRDQLERSGVAPTWSETAEDPLNIGDSVLVNGAEPRSGIINRREHRVSHAGRDYSVPSRVSLHV